LSLPYWLLKNVLRGSGAAPGIEASTP